MYDAKNLTSIVLFNSHYNSVRAVLLLACSTGEEMKAKEGKHWSDKYI